MTRAAGSRDQDFGAYDDEYRGFEPREGEGARGPLILALAIGVLLIFGAVIWNTYKQGVRENASALPIVLADATPYKRVPSDAGGTVAPDQNLRMYDQLDDSERPEPVETNMVAEPVLQGGPPIELRPGEEDDLDEATGLPRAVIPQVEALENLDDVPDAPTESADVTIEPAPQTAAVEETVLLPRSQFEFNPAGSFLVQIAALRTQAAADTAWSNAVAANPDIYTGAQKRIQRADLGAKGVFYRLRVGAFETRTKATAFCDALKARGETCIVATG